MLLSCFLHCHCQNRAVCISFSSTYDRSQSMSLSHTVGHYQNYSENEQ